MKFLKRSIFVIFVLVLFTACRSVNSELPADVLERFDENSAPKVPAAAVEGWDDACCSYITDVTYEFTYAKKASNPQASGSSLDEVWCVVIESNVDRFDGRALLTHFDFNPPDDWSATTSLDSGEWEALGCD